jgi:type II secretory pathway component PulC
LQDEDVLLRINEFSIDKPESALQAFTALKGMDRIQLDIVRDGAKASLTYQMR